MSHWILRHFWWITLTGAVLGSCFVILYCRWQNIDPLKLLGGVLATVLSFVYFVQKQKLLETQLFKELFIDFNRRYDELNDRLARIETSDQPPGLRDRQTIVDYFNLCAEEHLFFKEGYIHPAAWQSWCAGMMHYFAREPFRSIWDEERATNSYYGLSLDVIRKWAGAPAEVGSVPVEEVEKAA